jgi:purine-binding chemotaxis protein CheW
MRIATFYIDHELYAVPVLLIEEFFRPVLCTPVPLADPRIAGLIHVRGKSATVLDMRVCLGKSPNTNPTAGKMIMIVTKSGLTPEATALGMEAFDEPVVLWVDRVDRTIILDPKTVQPLPAHMKQNFLDGVARLDDQYITLVNVADLVLEILKPNETR